MPLKTTVAPAIGEKSPPLTGPLKVTIGPAGRQKGAAGYRAGERGTAGQVQVAGAADRAGESGMAPEVS